MATTETGALSLHAATTTTTAETWSLTTPVREVRMTNRDSTAIFATVSTARTAAAAEAGIVTAVASADGTIVIPAGATRVLWRGSRSRYVAGSVIGDASDYDVEGSDYHLGH
jgi:hypothetical protein